MAIDFDSYGTVTSGFGNRDTGIPGASTDHKGIDIVMDSGNVEAFISGIVVDKGTNSSAGNWIKILQSDGNTATYMHMAQLPKYAIGAHVSKGAILGKQGSTGISSGDHVHYQVQDSSGNYLDPMGDMVSTSYDDNESRDRETTIFGTLVRGSALVFIGVVGAFLFFKAFDIKII